MWIAGDCRQQYQQRDPETYSIWESALLCTSEDPEIESSAPAHEAEAVHYSNYNITLLAEDRNAFGVFERKVPLTIYGGVQAKDGVDA